MKTKVNYSEKAVNIYTEQHAKAIGAAERIAELLEDLPAPCDGHLINWNSVGSIQEVNARLAAVVAFLEGREV